MTTFCQHCNGRFQDNNFAIADGGYIHAKCGQVTMNTQAERVNWLTSHGWQHVDRIKPQDIRGIGLSARFEEQQAPHRGLWLAVSTGVALLDGPRDEAMTWQQLVAWIDGSEKVKKPLAGQRSLFGEDESD